MKHKTLNLTLSKAPFEIMLSGEKKVEFRKPSIWIKSRLFNKDGSRKDYDVVKFVNGYGSDKPYFIAIYNGVAQALGLTSRHYSNNLSVIIEPGDYQIYLGDIIKRGNIKK